MLEYLNIDEVLFIDIETVPIAPEYKELTEKWRQLWEHKMQFNIGNGETADDLYERAGIYAEFGKIICISAGYVTQKQGEQFFRVKSFYDDDEKKLISIFFNAWDKFSRAGKRRLCAHNGQEFDYPYIARRALVNKLTLPKIFDIAGSKPWEVKEQLIDTLQLWKFGDYKHYTSLSLLCELFNIPTPKDDIDGSQVAKIYWEENDLDRIIRYCEKDTLAVANLILRYKGKNIIKMENMEIA
ncbi:MAG: 3'-5' exonuclease [Prolixibacteraceae bacterium]|jgi:3'-5' exonuclease|nr:3'-5' exonuclease [Prolixibacteraceae bacterium]MBT6765536.1 3'-5' exonuclease [Prolixibacteraceae bacterium]MBT6997382.1 3'-5' exonuclease [Prolixibacteraceae bacterium]MBT7393220.1 3'-5' exonuclease [Prolixibacteraceae bacterium]